MATRTVKRSTTANQETDLFQQYLTLGVEEKRIKERRDEVKQRLSKIVDDSHVVDEEKGHLFHGLLNPLETLDGQYTGFMKQRKVSQVFLEDEAEALCKSLDLDADEYTSRYVDQDKIVRLYAEDKISDEQFNALFENRVGWAFVAVKE